MEEWTTTPWSLSCKVAEVGRQRQEGTGLWWGSLKPPRAYRAKAHPEIKDTEEK